MNRPPSRVLLLFKKDLLRRLRSPLGVLAMIAFPLIFAGLLVYYRHTFLEEDRIGADQ